MKSVTLSLEDDKSKLYGLPKGMPVAVQSVDGWWPYKAEGDDNLFPIGDRAYESAEDPLKAVQ